MKKNLTPWALDADVIKHQSDLNESYVVMNDRIEEFLDPERGDTKFILVAPKGVGKTLILKLKSAQHRNHRPSYTFIPKDELCDRMTVARLSLGRDEIKSFITPHIWEEIWLICLSCSILKAINGELPEAFATIFKESVNVSDHLNTLLSERGYVDKLRTEISRTLTPAIRNLDRPVSVYLDSVDESMAMHVGKTLKTHAKDGSAQSGSLDAKIWIYAQLGLMAAAKALYFTNRHIKVYASIRLEAFSQRHGNALQDLEYASLIQYSKQELKAIFALNINHTAKKKLFDTKAKDPIEKFLGATVLPHSFVKNPDGTNVLEDTFDYILRHTFGRPRELMLMGKKLAEMPKGGGDRDHSIRDVVNGCAAEIFNYLKDEMIPFWEEDVFKHIMSQVTGNTLTEVELRDVGENIWLNHQISHPFCWLINRGLMGFAERSRYDADMLVQKFRTTAEHIFEDHGNFPMGTEYFFHPCISDSLPRISGRFRISKINVIGNGYPYLIRPDGSKEGNPLVAAKP